MLDSIPKNSSIYRMVHKDNLPFILKNGMFASTHLERDQGYVFIGDQRLTGQRKYLTIPMDSKGHIGEYVAFYFFPRTPMLYNIQTGHRGIKKRDPEEIIYLACKLEEVIEFGVEYVFTDGHAKNSITQFYIDPKELSNIDWKLRKEKMWKNTEADRDRQRRKQAEFLIRDHIPVELIRNIGVYNEAAGEYVKKLLAEVQLNIDIHIDHNKQLYY